MRSTCEPHRRDRVNVHQWLEWRSVHLIRTLQAEIDKEAGDHRCRVGVGPWSVTAKQVRGTTQNLQMGSLCWSDRRCRSDCIGGKPGFVICSEWPRGNINSQHPSTPVTESLQAAAWMESNSCARKWRTERPNSWAGGKDARQQLSTPPPPQPLTPRKNQTH